MRGRGAAGSDVAEHRDEPIGQLAGLIGARLWNGVTEDTIAKLHTEMNESGLSQTF